MMASTSSAFFCAIMALVLWVSIGWLYARRLALHPALVLPLAPMLGWAVQNVIALVLMQLVGFSIPAILATIPLACLPALLPPGSVKSLLMRRDDGDAARLSGWIYLAAALAALIPAAAVMPKFLGDGVVLAAPIFDHSKVALIDEMLRNGLPPANPVFAEGGGAGSVSYYYLWHVGAAQIARLTGASGWEGDIGASWFSAFASMCLICGLARRFSASRFAPVLALAFALTGSLRPVLVALIGEERLHGVLKHGSGFAGWLFQTSWSPHHIAAASCLVIAVLLMTRLALRPGHFVAFVLTLILAAGFESSIWVGGFTLALAGGGVGLVLLWRAAPDRRPGFMMACLVAALGAAALSSPLIAAQIQAGAARGGGSPLALQPFAILGIDFPLPLRRFLDVPAYWLVLLLIEFPLIYVPGLLAFRRLLQAGTGDPETRLTLMALAVLTLACLMSSWLLHSTVGDNNDFGWRAVLPALLILIALAAGSVADWLHRRRVLSGLIMLATFALTLPDAATIMAGNLFGAPSDAAQAFAETPAMWASLRRHTAADTRIANNPAFLQNELPWPINISWALLADRRSCFAGNELAIAFAPLSPAQRAQSAALFLRVFDGSGSSDDVALLVKRYGCRAAVVTATDGAWVRDPFASSPLFRLAETAAGKWRIYVAAEGTE
jgi:hypothetical protein